MEYKPFAVRVVKIPIWFFFDYYKDAEWFMELCAQSGESSSVFKVNELGQYEFIASCDGYTGEVPN